MQNDKAEYADLPCIWLNLRIKPMVADGTARLPRYVQGWHSYPLWHITFTLNAYQPPFTSGGGGDGCQTASLYSTVTYSTMYCICQKSGPCLLGSPLIYNSVCLHSCLLYIFIVQASSHVASHSGIALQNRDHFLLSSTVRGSCHVGSLLLCYYIHTEVM